MGDEQRIPDRLPTTWRRGLEQYERAEMLAARLKAAEQGRDVLQVREDDQSELGDRWDGLA